MIGWLCLLFGLLIYRIKTYIWWLVIPFKLRFNYLYKYYYYYRKLMKLVNALKQMKYPFGMFTHSDIKTDLKAMKHHFENLPADNYLSKRHKLPPQKVMR